MKVKTNIRAGAKSGTVASGGGGGTSGRDPSKPPSTDSIDVVTPAPTPVTYTRCVGI